MSSLRSSTSRAAALAVAVAVLLAACPAARAAPGSTNCSPPSNARRWRPRPSPRSMGRHYAQASESWSRSADQRPRPWSNRISPSSKVSPLASIAAGVDRWCHRSDPRFSRRPARRALPAYRGAKHDLGTAASAARGDSWVRIPVPVDSISTRRVLVMERLEGRPISAIEPSAPTEDRDVLARQLLNCLLRQIMVDGVSHADPHPGNILSPPCSPTCFASSPTMDLPSRPRSPQCSALSGPFRNARDPHGVTDPVSRRGLGRGQVLVART